MPITPTRRNEGKLVSPSPILDALTDERDFANSGIAFNTANARWEGSSMVIGIERRKGRRSVAIEETLEGCRAVWGADLENKGEVLVVNTDAGEIVLRFARGALPTTGERILLYQRDFLTPLIDLWQLPECARKAMRENAKCLGAVISLN